MLPSRGIKTLAACLEQQKYLRSKSVSEFIFFFPPLKASSLSPSVLHRFLHLFPNSLTGMFLGKICYLQERAMRTEDRDASMRYSTGRDRPRCAASTLCSLDSHCQKQKEQNPTAAHCGVQFYYMLYFIFFSNASKVLRNTTQAQLQLSSIVACPSGASQS